MRSNQTCPKCVGQKFLVTDELRQPDERGDGTHALRAVTLRWENVFGEGVRPELGRFETWICLRCGFTELYAQKLPHDIEAIAKQHPDQLRIVDAGPPKQGPYR